MGDDLVTKRPAMRHRDHYGYVLVFVGKDHPLAYKNGYAREHRLVAYDAGLLTDLGCDVHHRNGIKDDNRIENLEVLSPHDHQLRHNLPRLPKVQTCVVCGKVWTSKRGGLTRTCGPRCFQTHSGKLTPEQVREIKTAMRGGERRQEVADRFGITRRTVGDIVFGRSWVGVEP